MAKKDVFHRWKTHGLKYKIITGIAFGLSLLVVPLFLLVLFIMLVTQCSFVETWNSGLLYGLYAAALLAITLFILFELRVIGSRRVLKVNKNLEDSRFLEKWEIKRNDGFTVTKFSKLGEAKDGLLISAEQSKNDLDVVLLNPIHSLIIATTGTGKTSAYVSPFIEILSRTSTKPCMVITDPKGELYERHANTLIKNGYHVHIINLAMTYCSTLWNPFNDVWRKTERLSEPIVQERNKYYWGGKTFSSNSEAEKEKYDYTVRLSDEIYIDLQDLIYAACPVDAGESKTWQQGARDLIFAMALRMWEDVRDGYMPKEKFNIYNLWWNLTQYAKDDCEALKNYIDECSDEKSRAPGMANTVLVSEDRTLSSYLGSVNQYLHWMADGGVAQLTSGNEIEFSEWDEEPNVLFIKFPDAKKGRHGVVTLMLVQLYKALLEKATLNNERKETSDERLKRNCYFLMDEFGSLPKIDNFEKIVPIARSRKIFLMPVIQDFKQLDSTYGQDAAAIIRNNCNVKIFMGTNDDKTRAEISEACGKHKVKNVSYNENKDMSVSTSAQNVPLIYPSELKDLNNPDNGVFGNAVVLVSGVFPIRSHTTPYFKAMEIYGIEDGAEAPQKEFMHFNEEENRYDIARLIFLHEALDMEQHDEESQVEDLSQAVAEETIRKAAFKQLKLQIKEEIADLQGRIDEDDFLRLAVADVSGKIEILDALAEQATQDGDIFLAMRLEKVLGFLRHGSLGQTDGEVIESIDQGYAKFDSG